MANYFRAVGLGIVNAFDKQLLSKNRGPLTLTKTNEHGKRKGGCSAKMHVSDTEFEKLKEGTYQRFTKQ